MGVVASVGFCGVTIRVGNGTGVIDAGSDGWRKDELQLTNVKISRNRQSNAMYL
jgi:hypothetical protein